MDLLIRDVPDDVVAALDAEAKRLGTSRAEIIRRTLTHAFPHERGAVTREDWVRLETVYADLADAEVMEQAWR
ncbi:MAG TPA: ribbon-helix-helix protein, CopG family [Actinoplanes sp.]|nr:ribbon-helix-helix protein, CopG family [Actinoplanes sp.]